MEGGGFLIPKIIHYCWFGGHPLPKNAKKCIRSWRKFFPDYEIKEWNESNFDINFCSYTREAAAAKKWAFVSDVARFVILYQYGGVYFDTDVEVIRPMDDLLEKGGFMGMERDFDSVNPGLGLAVAPGLGLIKEIIDRYESYHFLDEEGNQNSKTVVEYTTEYLMEQGLENKPGIQKLGGGICVPSGVFLSQGFGNRQSNNH